MWWVELETSGLADGVSRGGTVVCPVPRVLANSRDVVGGAVELETSGLADGVSRGGTVVCVVARVLANSRDGVGGVVELEMSGLAQCRLCLKRWYRGVRRGSSARK